MLETLIFDAGDIIVLRNEDAYIEAVNKLQKSGWKGSHELFMTASREIHDTLSKGLGEEALQLILNHYDIPSIIDYQNLEVQAFWDNPHPDAQELFRALKSQGLKIGILTDSVLPEMKVRAHLERHNLLQYIDTVCTSASLKFMKPAPEAYLDILKRLNAEPNNTSAFIGHSEDEIIGAQAIGLLTIENSPVETGLANYHVTNLLDLITLTKELNTK